MKLLIISGRSGSGKSVCLRALEDIGYNCTDNLPVSLLEDFTRLFLNQDKIAVGIDARNMPSKLLQFDKYIQDSLSAGAEIKIVYLDANDATLIKRFSETRRKHPLTTNTRSLQEAIALESSLLTPIADLSDITINTNHMTSPELQSEILNRIGLTHSNNLSLLIQSFGYKKGIPADADYVFDIRCLPNPYWDINLRKYNGKDKQIINYLESKPIVNNMYESIIKFTENWIPHIKSNQRSYLTISIGCTGGQHRSVYMTEKIGEFYKDLYPTLIRHRELDLNNNTYEKNL